MSFVFFQLGLGMFGITFVNFYTIISAILKTTPNWRDDDISTSDIVMNWVKETPQEKLEFYQKLSTTLFWTLSFGVLCLFIGLII